MVVKVIKYDRVNSLVFGYFVGKMAVFLYFLTSILCK